MGVGGRLREVPVKSKGLRTPYLQGVLPLPEVRNGTVKRTEVCRSSSGPELQWKGPVGESWRDRFVQCSGKRHRGVEPVSSKCLSTLRQKSSGTRSPCLKLKTKTPPSSGHTSCPPSLPPMTFTENLLIQSPYGESRLSDSC